ncbi:MAG: alkaline phosphatase family protein [Jatrophihabitantaceae bacterium]
MRLFKSQLTALVAATALTAGLVASAAGTAAASVPDQLRAGTVPQPAHTVVVMMENHSYSEIIGSSSAPYINSLATGGALFTNSFGTTHPSEPNYLAIFSGSTHSLTSDSCPHTYTTQNLGSELITTGLTFKGYSESMPSNGYTGCTSGAYARKHNPWVNFTSNVPAASNLTFSSFPTSFSSLPTVSFVIPNLNDDMHDGTIAAGDTWLKNNIGAYATWAKANNSLLVVTWDEDDSSQSNQIPTIFYGGPVKTGSYSEKVTHYGVLRTIEQAYGLPYVGSSATATPITDAWQ